MRATPRVAGHTELFLRLHLVCWRSAPFRKYLNAFIDPTCGWLRTVAQMRGLAYRSIPFRQAGDAAAYLAGPTDLPPSRRSVSFPDPAPLPTPPPPATHGPFPRAAPQPHP